MPSSPVQHLIAVVGFLAAVYTSADAQPWKVFIDRLEIQMQTSIQAAPRMTATDLARRIAEDVDAMRDDIDDRLASSLHVFFSVVVWPAEIAAEYQSRAISGDATQMFVRNYGHRYAEYGYVPFPGCVEVFAWARAPLGNLGRPCSLGGAGAVTAPDQNNMLWNCMVVFLPKSAPLLGERTGGGSSPPTRSIARLQGALQRCKKAQHGRAFVDLTEMAYCIYGNYPRAHTEYPPRASVNAGFRLRGVAVLPGGEDEQLPPRTGAWLPFGFLVVTYFDVFLDMNAAPLTLTCIAGVLKH